MTCHVCGHAARVESRIRSPRFPDVVIAYLVCPACGATFLDQEPARPAPTPTRVTRNGKETP